MNRALLVILFLISSCDTRPQGQAAKSINRYVCVEKYTLANKWGTPRHYIVLKDLDNGEFHDFSPFNSSFFSIQKGDTLITNKKWHEY